MSLQNANYEVSAVTDDEDDNVWNDGLSNVCVLVERSIEQAGFRDPNIIRYRTFEFKKKKEGRIIKYNRNEKKSQFSRWEILKNGFKL